LYSAPKTATVELIGFSLRPLLVGSETGLITGISLDQFKVELTKYEIDY